ncbi:cation-translocating P-type ATPase [Marichromatium sp. AB31]|uniref:heavy metal translocating P-type ATPase n=1 Tax=Marichromatium sp. AB31 TaxID=2483362 RepID=UPI000F3C20C1|nr:cation-translocating P-type ATPase [Marichromatium sp. AB31]RNE88658.1 cation-translocating P-type ATPase [Marichromatium sp. AB31]
MIQIRHQIPGRIRLRIPALARNRPLADWIEHELGAVPGVEQATCNPGCASLVVRYGHSRLDPETIRAHLEAIIAHPIDPTRLTCDPADGRCRSCQRGAQDQTPTLGRILSLVLLAGYLGYVLIREHLLKRPVAQNPLSPTGVIALAGAIPLLRDAWHETFVERRFSLHQFLAFSLVLGILMGEALTAFEIILVLRGGELLEGFVANRSRRAIRRMLALSVKDAWVWVDGQELQVAVAELREGDRVVVRTGEKIPIDGVIEHGEAELNEASISGRSEPVFKQVGDAVFAGGYVERGVIRIRAERVGEATYLARMAALVDASLDQKAPVQQRADELAARLLRLGTLSTLATLVLTRSVERALTVMLVMSCPCSTVLAAATAVSAALHSATRRQMLIKGGIHLERVGTAPCLCFDKTGTLTTETPEVATVIGDDEDALLYWAASAEHHNTHALAHAIVRHAETLGIEPDTCGISEHLLGHGLEARIGEHRVLVGNARMMASGKVSLRRYKAAAEQLIDSGLTAVYVALDGKALGVIGIRHQLRAEVHETLARLRADGVSHIALISGDEPRVAAALAEELGLDSCHGGRLPEDKAEVVRALRAEHGAVVMVGDGVNDALALAEADIGIAMGSGGSEVAIEVADIALADSAMGNLAELRALSRQTLRVADQNYYLAVGTDVAGIALGAAGILSPAMGGLIHVTHTLGILANSSRLLRAR